MANRKADIADVRERLAVLQLKVPGLSAATLLEIETRGQQLLQRPRIRLQDLRGLLDTAAAER